MAEDYSVRAVLSAYDKGFSSAMQAAAKQTDALNGGMSNAIKTGGAMALGMKGLDMAIGAVSSHMGAAIDRFDTIEKFPKVMEQLGFKASDAADVMENKLGPGIEGLPTAMDEIVKSTQSIALITGDLDGAADTAIALNNAFLASGSSAWDASRGLTQYTQMLTTGKVDMQSWRTLLETMSPALQQVAKEFGYTGASAKNDLYNALKSGEITFDDFNKKLIELSEAEGGFAEQARTNSTGIRTSFQNVGTAVTKGIADSIKAIETLMKENGLGGIKENADRVKKAVNSAFKSINKTISKIDLKGIVKAAKPYWNAFVKVLKVVGSAIKTVANFLAEHAGIITKVGIPLALMVATWSKLATVLSIVKGPLALITGGFSKLAGGVLAKLAPQLVTTAAAETSAGTAAATAAGSMLRLGAGIALVGLGVALVGAGFGLLAQAAIGLSNAGGTAIAVFFGMTAALAGLMVVVALLGPALIVGAIGMAIFGAAVLLTASGVLVAALGIKLMAAAVPSLAASAGTAAAGLLKLAAATVGLGAASAAAGAASIALGALALAAKLAGKGAKSGANGIKQLKSAATQAASGLRALITALKSVASQAKTAGTAVGKGFANGVKSQKGAAKSAGNALGKGAAAGVKSQKGAATTAGKNVAQGTINGLKSKNGAAYRAGVAAGKAYNKGLKDTEKSHSPSRVTTKIGQDIGQGLVNGLQAKNKLVEKMGIMAAGLYNSAISPMGGMAYAGGLSDEYSYGRRFEVYVPLSIDGKEFARATSKYTEAEQNRRQMLNNRKSGIR